MKALDPSWGGKQIGSILQQYKIKIVKILKYFERSDKLASGLKTRNKSLVTDMLKTENYKKGTSRSATPLVDLIDNDKGKFISFKCI